MAGEVKVLGGWSRATREKGFRWNFKYKYNFKCVLNSSELGGPFD